MLDSNKIELKLQGLSEVVGTGEIYLIMLFDAENKRQLIVPCDVQARMEIQNRMMEHDQKEGSKYATCLPEVMASLLKDDILSSYEIDIYGFNEGQYLAELRESTIGRVYPLRCSDAVLLSMVSGIKMFADADLMNHQSVPFVPGERRIALPVNVITDEMLKMSLKQAIEDENYEAASNLRDELKRRHPAPGNTEDNA
jgi:uncharacterized protein